MNTTVINTNYTATRADKSAEFPKLRDPLYPVHRIAERLEPYLQSIVGKIHPLKLILFGSYAYGEPTEHSDVDLLVVRREITSPRESDLEILRALRGIEPVRLPFTILSLTPDRLESLLAHGSHFYDDIIRQGVEVYAE